MSNVNEDTYILVLNFKLLIVNLFYDLYFYNYLTCYLSIIKYASDSNVNINCPYLCKKKAQPVTIIK